MRDNTPPRGPDIDDDEVELIHLENDLPPPDDDEDEMELREVTLEELEQMYADSEEDEPRRVVRSRSAVPDESQLAFQKHTAPIFGASLHPTRELAATGGEDDRAFVWDYTTGEVLYEFAEHKDTVTEVHFNHDGTLLATGDMSGELFVHKLRDSESGTTFTKIWEFPVGDMNWLRWHRAANVLFAAIESGEVFFWRIPTSETKILPSDGVRCEVADLSHDGKKLFCAYSNGVLKLWDLKTCSVVMEVTSDHPLSHGQAVTAVACEKESPLSMSGGEEGKIIFCTPTGPVGQVETDGPVECVAFSPASELKLAASGSLHGQIAIWDYAKYALRTLCDHPEEEDGITRLKWLDGHTLVVSTVQGNIYAYDVRSGTRKFSLSGHLSDVYELCIKPADKILLSVSEDNTARIFKIPELGN